MDLRLLNHFLKYLKFFKKYIKKVLTKLKTSDIIHNVLDESTTNKAKGS